MNLPTLPGGANRYLRYSYTDDNLVASIDAPSPATAGQRVTAATYSYDADGRALKSVDANNVATTTNYYADGLVSQKIGQPAGSITHVTGYTYDAAGNVIRTLDPVGNTSSATYTPNNWKATTTDAAGNTISYYFDADGNPSLVYGGSVNAHDPNNTFGWTAQNFFNVDHTVQSSTIAYTNANGYERQTAYTYDGAGRKIAQHNLLVTGANPLGSGTPVSGGDGGTQSFSYYPSGLPNTETGRNGEAISKTYDSDGDLLKVTDSTSATTVTAQYYLDGSVRQADDGSRRTNFTYDGLGAIASRTEQVDPTGAVYSEGFQYNDASMVASVQSGSFGSLTRSYDGGGRLSSETQSNSAVLRPTYNADNTVAAMTLSQSGGTQLGSWTYGYDGSYRQTSSNYSAVTASAGNQTWSFGYQYDKANRLSNVAYTGPSASQQHAVAYDHDGNRQNVFQVSSSSQATFTYNADDSIANISVPGYASVAYTYDNAGRIVNDGCNVYTYDGFDRKTGSAPVTTNRPAACGSATNPTTMYTYDGLDRQHSHNTGGGAVTAEYDGLSSAVIDEWTSSTDTEYQLDEGGTAKAVVSGGTKQVLTQDGQGDLAAVTSSSQSMLCTVVYDPGGQTVASQSATNPCTSGSTSADLMYKGGQLDTSTGEYQFGSRTYNTVLSAFLTPDKYRFGETRRDVRLGTDPMTMNRYGYVNGDPVNLKDPNGHGPMCNHGPDCAELQDTPSPEGGSMGGQSAAQNAGGPSQLGYSGTINRPPPQRSVFHPQPGKVYPCTCPAPKPPAMITLPPPPTLDPRLQAAFNIAYGGQADEVMSEDPGTPWGWLGGVVANNKLDVLLTIGTAILQVVPGGGEVADAALATRLAAEGGEIAVDGAAAATEAGGAASVRLGQAGEAAVRGRYDIGPKAAAVVGGRARIFDGLTDDAVSEVKNVASQAYTQQLKDTLWYAQQNGLRFDLYVRRETNLTGPLQDAISGGLINLRFIP